MENELLKLKNFIDESNYIVFFGGAGVSTESGIPDFRSENGIFDALRVYGQPPEVLLSHSFFMRHTETFFEYYKSSLLVTDAQPNAAHIALAHLERSGKLKAVITQNVDGLHQKAGSRAVYELHGSIYRNRCMKCGKAFDALFVQQSEGVPRCSCGEVVKPEVVLYEESLPENELNGAIEHIMKADMLLVGGTSLAVYPAAGLLNYYHGNKLVLINKSPTGYDGRADLIINKKIGETLKKVMG
ncbi:MAG: NAD-dependent protein deacylase [Clostridia bacterium]|nr:NAD-dependent protein deacylase [Clostridia bacterium]